MLLSIWNADFSEDSLAYGARSGSNDFNRLISISQNSAVNKRPQHTLRGIKYSVCAVYSPENRAEVHCLQLNFRILKLAYCIC